MDLERVGFISDGGGYTGIFNVGHKKAVRYAGIKPIYEQGVSVGALNGSTESQEELEEIWRWVEKQGPGVIFPWWHPLWRLPLFKNSAYTHRGVDKLLDFIDYGRLARSPRKFDVVTFNESQQKQVIFSTTDPEVQSCPASMREYIRASASLQGIFPPVLINGEWYSDGTAFLLEPAIQAGCRTIFVFANDVAGFSMVSHRSVAWKRLSWGLILRLAILNEREIKHARKVSEAINVLAACQTRLQHLNRFQQWTIGKEFRHLQVMFDGKFPVDIVVFQPTKPIPSLWTLGFKKGSFPQAIAHTYEVDMRIYEEIVFRS